MRTMMTFGAPLGTWLIFGVGLYVDSCMVRLAMLPEGWGGNGSTSCAVTAGERIALIARQAKKVKETRMRRNGVELRLCVQTLPKETNLSWSFTFPPFVSQPESPLR